MTPFDQQNFEIDVPAKTQEWAPGQIPPFAKGLEGLRRLAYVLRHPHLWSPGFKWDFANVEQTVEPSRFPKIVQRLLGINSHCGTAGCAIGCGRALWPEFRDATTANNTDATHIARLFEIPYRNAKRIFLSGDAYRVRELRNVTPDDVADAIDAYLTSHS